MLEAKAFTLNGKAGSYYYAKANIREYQGTMIIHVYPDTALNRDVARFGYKSSLQRTAPLLPL